MNLKRRMKREQLRRAWKGLREEDKKPITPREVEEMARRAVYEQDAIGPTRWVIEAAPWVHITILLVIVGIGFALGRYL